MMLSLGCKGALRTRMVVPGALVRTFGCFGGDTTRSVARQSERDFSAMVLMQPGLELR